MHWNGDHADRVVITGVLQGVTATTIIVRKCYVFMNTDDLQCRSVFVEFVGVILWFSWGAIVMYRHARNGHQAISKHHDVSIEHKYRTAIIEHVKH